MINRTDSHAPELPPVTPCPAWCRKGFHAWEPDGDEWVRAHGAKLSAPAASYSLELYAADWWADDGLHRAEPCVILNGEELDPTDAAGLLVAAQELMSLGALR